MAKYMPVIWINFLMDTFRRATTSKVERKDGGKHEDLAKGNKS